jgi:hypothetical protein
MGTSWTQQAYLKGSHLQAGDMLGFAVALSFDGHTLVTSAFDERGSGRTINGPRDNTAGGAGALYVFVRDGGAWAQQAYIKGSRTGATDQLGYVVAISDDGNTVAAGAGDEDCLTPGINPPGCDNDSPPRGAANIWVGAAYVFVRSGTTWTEQQKLTAGDGFVGDRLGSSVSVAGDTALVGAPHDGDLGSQSGAASAHRSSRVYASSIAMAAVSFDASAFTAFSNASRAAFSSPWAR